jgi:hypothetical protein
MQKITPDSGIALLDDGEEFGLARDICHCYFVTTYRKVLDQVIKILTKASETTLVVLFILSLERESRPRYIWYFPALDLAIPRTNHD